MAAIQQMLMAMAGGGVNLPLIGSGCSLLDTAFDPGNASAGIVFQSDGTITYNASDASLAGSANWFLPTTVAIGAGFWIRRTITAGSLSTDPGAGWLALSTGRNYVRNRTSIGTNTCSLYFEIATDSGGSTIVATSPSFDLNAEVA
jgi:hypothetical protein